MELINDFRVDVPIDRAWEVLTDLERIAPCMPGAELQEIEGDEHRGIVKVKVGPITAQYKGTARFIDKDDSSYTAVVRAEGRETRGQGNAHATITATLQPDETGTGTHVSVITDLTVTGKVAQFGRGVMVDVSSRLLDQFVEALETQVLAPGAAAAAPVAAAPPAAAPSASVDTPAAPAAAPEGASAAVRTINSPSAKPVDLLDAAGAPVAKRVAPVLALVAVGWLVRLFVRRRFRRG